jgi:hypothetical protein
VIELVKAPVPVPSVVWLPVAIGLAAVDQHTPLAVTDAPPSAVTLPPEEAVVDNIDVGVVVVTVGKAVSVVNWRSLPYAVPPVLVA